MTVPTLEEFKLWLGLTDPSDTADDVALQGSLDAALEAQARVVRYPTTIDLEPVFTPDLTTAVFVRALRLVARRSSPESVVGITGTDGDFVGARLPSADSDVIRLEGPYFIHVVA